MKCVAGTRNQTHDLPTLNHLCLGVTVLNIVVFASLLTCTLAQTGDLIAIACHQIQPWLDDKSYRADLQAPATEPSLVLKV